MANEEGHSGERRCWSTSGFRRDRKEQAEEETA